MAINTTNLVVSKLTTQRDMKYSMCFKFANKMSLYSVNHCLLVLRFHDDPSANNCVAAFETRAEKDNYMYMYFTIGILNEFIAVSKLHFSEKT